MSRKMGLEKKLELLYHDWKESQLKDVEVQIKQDKYKMLVTLCSELDCVSLSKSEHASLLERATKGKEQVDEEVKKDVEDKTGRLQKQLDHMLEMSELKHQVAIARLEAKVEMLELQSLKPLPLERRDNVTVDTPVVE